MDIQKLPTADQLPSRKLDTSYANKYAYKIISYYSIPRTYRGFDLYASYKDRGEFIWRIGYGSTEIRDKVISAVQSYSETSGTEKFRGKFRHSKFTGVIDDVDRSINSNLTAVTMRRDFYPQLNSTFFYEVCYQNAFDEDCDDPVLSSTGFRVTEHPTYDVYLEDRDKKIVLYRLDPTTGDKVVLDKEVGDIDYVKGELKLYDLTIIKGSFFDNRISLRVKPLSNDIKALREMYLDVDIANSSFVAYKE